MGKLSNRVVGATVALLETAVDHRNPETPAQEPKATPTPVAQADQGSGRTGLRMPSMVSSVIEA
jgi:hypothetical protein